MVFAFGDLVRDDLPLRRRALDLINRLLGQRFNYNFPQNPQHFESRTGVIGTYVALLVSNGRG